MAKKVKEWPWQGRSRGLGVKYPYDKWMDGSIWMITKGEDFTCTANSMRSALFSAAKERGLKVRTSVVKGSKPEQLVFQAVKVDGTPMSYPSEG